ncbi:MAG: isocitrate/isopropylmalate dehydrogenase family protein [Chloroflexota bacterium]
MSYRITLIPGDGVGPEVSQATIRVLDASGVTIHWDTADAGEPAQARYGTPLPDNVLASIRKNKIALKGPVTTPVGYGFRSVNFALRKTFDLYACLRPCKIFAGVPTRYENVDIVIVRENTEDLYSGIEFEKGTPQQAKFIEFVNEISQEKIRPDSGISIKAISEMGSRRIVQFAFDYALKHDRKKVTAIHKANIMKYSDGLFLSVAREVAQGYPSVEFEDMIIDTLCMQLVRRPETFDILVLPNLYGDLISELCAGLIGGVGVAPGANIGRDYAIFEPTHGSAPHYAGQNKVNPMGMMLSAVLMLRHLGETKAADRMEMAIARVIAEGKKVTYDLKRDDGPPAGTSEVADAVIEAMEMAHAK